MALGGGSFLARNKVLPGTYVNFVSAAKASASLSDRGVATMPVILDWGAQNTVMEVSSEDFQKNSLKLFGHAYTAPQLKGLRDLFRNIRLAYLFRLGSGGAKAENAHARAKHTGTRGNDLRIVIAESVDDALKFDVSLYLGTTLVDMQTVSSASGLADNDFVEWKTGTALAQTAGIPLTGGTSPIPTNGDFQTYLDILDGYAFNAIGCPSDESEVKGLFTAFTKRMRDERGAKFQCVTFNNPADYEGVVSVMNSVTDTDAENWNAVYWVTGVIAGTAVNKSALNKVYDGEFAPDVNYTQAQLEAAMNSGQFTFHRVDSSVRVLADINSLTTFTEEKNDIFKENQTIRVIDQIANDIAVLFNTKYLGIVPNDADGRISLWSDIVKHHEQLQTLRAIENFKGDDVKVFPGDTKRSVVVSDAITVVNAMAQLYMTVTVA